MRVMPRIPIVGASALAMHGQGYEGLADAIVSRTLPLAGTIPLPAAQEPSDVRQRKLMSRAAWMGALGIRGALRDAGWNEARSEIGAYLGVGASGAETAELDALVCASEEHGKFSLNRCGRDGLSACNPLFAFQIMNNFTLCHGAILEGIAGPNAAFFSRGAGTVGALEEAVFALDSGDCSRALAGGADTALHPITFAELEREGWLAQGLLPAEGAAILALDAKADRAIAYVERCGVVPRLLPDTPDAEHTAKLDDGIRSAVEDLRTAEWDLLVIAPWGGAARKALERFSQEQRRAAVLDTTAVLGETLAATPALAWVAALDRIAAGRAGRALVLSAGPDGDLGLVVLAKGEA